MWKNVMLVMWMVVAICDDRFRVLAYSTMRLGVSTTIDYDLADFDEFGNDPGNTDTINFGADLNLNPQNDIGYFDGVEAVYDPTGLKVNGAGSDMEPVSDEDIDGPNASTEDQTQGTLTLTPDNDNNQDAISTVTKSMTSDPDPDYDDAPLSTFITSVQPDTVTQDSTSPSASSLPNEVENGDPNKRLYSRNKQGVSNSIKTNVNGGSSEIPADKSPVEVDNNLSNTVDNAVDDQLGEGSSNIDHLGSSNSTSTLNTEEVSKSDDQAKSNLSPSTGNTKESLSDGSSSDTNEALSTGTYVNTKSDDSSGDSNSDSSGTDESNQTNSNSNLDTGQADDVDNNSDNGNSNNHSSRTNDDLDKDITTAEMKSISTDHINKESVKISKDAGSMETSNDSSLSVCFSDEGKMRKLCHLATSLHEICKLQFSRECSSGQRLKSNMGSSNSKESTGHWSAEEISASGNDAVSMTAETLETFSASYEKASGILEIMNMIQNMCPKLCSMAASVSGQQGSKQEQSHSVATETPDEMDNDTSTEDSVDNDMSADEMDEYTTEASESADIDYTLDDGINSASYNHYSYKIDRSNSFERSSGVTNIYVPDHDISNSVTGQSEIGHKSMTMNQSNESN